MMPRYPDRSRRLAELAFVFLKLGTLAFGGPAAHIAMMEEEIVRRRQWISHDDFLDLLGAVNLIPGPNSTELAIHIGPKRAGWAGLLVAGTCFIFPAAILVGIIAWAYVRFGKLPQAEGLLYGVKPVIIAVVAQALWSLGRTAIKTRRLALLGVADIALAFLGVHELLLLFGSGMLMAIDKALPRSPHRTKAIRSLVAAGPKALTISFLGLAGSAVVGLAGSVAAPFSLGKLFLLFVKIGSTLFGSGYVLLAFIRTDFVEHRHWLTENQLLDAIAVGQFTPGPVFTTATFIGYLLNGSRGAVIATLGIFLPAFFFVALSGPLLPRLRASPLAGGFLDGVNAASLALMGVVSWQLGAATLKDWPSVSIFTLSLFLLLRFKVNSAWLVLAGALLGAIIFR